jgi:hypothetical protein
MRLFRNKTSYYIWFIFLIGIIGQSLLPYASTKVAETYINTFLHVACFFILAFLPTYDLVNRS